MSLRARIDKIEKMKQPDKKLEALNKLILKHGGAVAPDIATALKVLIGMMPS